MQVPVAGKYSVWFLSEKDESLQLENLTRMQLLTKCSVFCVCTVFEQERHKEH
jgi:hypothetical protein